MIDRGDIITIAQRGIYSGKPRPAVVIQAVGLEHHPSILVCLITSRDTIRRNNIGKKIGQLDPATTGKLNTALALFLGLG